MTNTHNMNFKGIEYLYAQALPITAQWLARVSLDGISKDVILICSALTAFLFLVKMGIQVVASIRDLKKDKDENN